MRSSLFARRIVRGLILTLALLAWHERPAMAQGCVASKMDAPVFGVPISYEGPDKWEIATTWRNFKSDRHFVGHEEQVNRTTEHSQVINRVNQLEVSIKRNYSKGWSFNVGIPYLMAERSSPIRDPNTNEV